jgi:hypothetical protein
MNAAADDDLAATLFAFLREMDAETGVTEDCKPIGLNWYGRQRKPRPRVEVEWTRELERRLRARGHDVRGEHPYPDKPPRRCDLVVTTADGRRTWIEVKGAWKDYWARKRNLAMFRAYLLHPREPYPKLGKEHTAALDVAKLGRLARPHADAVALLLVGFDTADLPIAPDFADLVRFEGLDRAPWTAQADDWTDAAGRGVHARYWTRAVAGL